MSVNVTSAGAPPIDILVTDADSRPIAVVEVKNKEDLSREDAIRLLRDLVTYPRLPNAAYYLVVSQEHGYLWTGPLEMSDPPPALQFAMDSVVERYSPAPSMQRRLRGGDLTVAVARWLLYLTREEKDLRMDPEAALRDVGFVDAMRAAIVIPEPYA